MKQESQSEKLEKIILLINNSLEEKRDSDFEDIKTFLSNHYSYLRTIFKRIDQSDLEKFIKSLKCTTYQNGCQIETQGLQSSKFCIVMKGRVKINSSNNGRKRQHHQNKMIIKQGERIGGESLLLSKPNLYSLSADSDQLVLLEVNRFTFDKWIKLEEQERFKQSIDFLKQCQLFRHINNEAIITMILYNSIKIQFDTGEIVYQQDQNCYAIYIVVQGKFQVQKKFIDECEQTLNQSVSINGEFEDNTPRNGGKRMSFKSDQSSLINTYTILKLRVVESSDIFGEEEIIENKQRGNSVVCMQDCSQVLVIRPIIYKFCLLNDEFIKKKLIEIVGQKFMETKEKENQKKYSYQSLGNKSRKSSLVGNQSPKAFQGLENKESKFAKEFKQNFFSSEQYKNESFSISDTSNSDMSPTPSKQYTQREYSTPQNYSNNNNNFKKESGYMSSQNTQRNDQTKDIDSFGGFVKYQEQALKESLFSGDMSTKVSKNNNGCDKYVSLSPKNLTPRYTNEVEAEYDNLINSWCSQMEVSGKKIGETTTFFKKDSNQKSKMQSHKVNALPANADFQVGPYQQQNSIYDEARERSKTGQQPGKRMRGSPLKINIQSKKSQILPPQNINEEIKLIKNEQQQQFYNSFNTTFTCNSPLLTSLSQTVSNRSLKQFPRPFNQPNNASSIFNKGSRQPSLPLEQLGENLKNLSFLQKDSQQDSLSRQYTKQANDNLIEQTQIFTKNSNLPISTFSQHLKIKNKFLMREKTTPILKQKGQLLEKSNSMKVQNQIHENVVNRPAIMIPNTIPLQSPISTVYSTQLNLSTLQQLKDSYYPNSPFLIEKFTTQAGYQFPKFTKINHINFKMGRNKSQPLQNKRIQNPLIIPINNIK